MTRRYAIVLGLLLAAFVLRVCGQLIVATGHGAGWLPSMNEWYSGLIPYPPLFVSQIAIVLLLGTVVWQFAWGRGFFVRPNGTLGSVLDWLGWLYLASMVIRYAVLRRGTIPVIVHCVLASFLLVLAQFHRRQSRPASWDARA